MPLWDLLELSEERVWLVLSSLSRLWLGQLIYCQQHGCSSRDQHKVACQVPALLPGWALPARLLLLWLACIILIPAQGGLKLAQVQCLTLTPESCIAFPWLLGKMVRKLECHVCSMTLSMCYFFSLPYQHRCSLIPEP